MAAPSPPDELAVWYMLVDVHEDPFKNAEVFAVSMPSNSSIFQLCMAIYSIHRNMLARFDAPELKVFSSFKDHNLGKPPMAVSHKLSSLPVTTEENPMYIVVPNKDQSPESSPPRRTESSKEPPLPDLERRKRWQMLNSVFARVKTQNTNDKVWITTPPKTSDEEGDDEETAITMAHLIGAYQHIVSVYKLEPKPVPDATLRSLHEYLTCAGKSFGPVDLVGDAGRLQLVAPILVQVCNLFDGDVRIQADATINGIKNLHFDGTFDFVLSRWKKPQKRICVVFAKRNNFGQGMAHALLGCELIADMENLDCVYGVVTDYFEWRFIKRLDDRIELVSDISLPIRDTTPYEDYLSKIVGYIHTMLSE